jgi:hypothetical protein
MLERGSLLTRKLLHQWFLVVKLKSLNLVFINNSPPFSREKGGIMFNFISKILQDRGICVLNDLSRPYTAVRQ